MFAKKTSHTSVFLDRSKIRRGLLVSKIFEDILQSRTDRARSRQKYPSRPGSRPLLRPPSRSRLGKRNAASTARGPGRDGGVVHGPSPRPPAPRMDNSWAGPTTRPLPPADFCTRRPALVRARKQTNQTHWINPTHSLSLSSSSRRGERSSQDQGGHNLDFCCKITK